MPFQPICVTMRTHEFTTHPNGTLGCELDAARLARSAMVKTTANPMRKRDQEPTHMQSKGKKPGNGQS